jgi:hypothetical protein
MSEHLTPIKAIRRHCLSCSGDSPKEVRLCVIPECPLYPFRLGKNPNRKSRILSQKQKDEIRDRLTKARKK